MKILLDECVPVQVGSALVDHEVHSVTSGPWRGQSNGNLLALAEDENFDLIIVADKNLRHKQNLAERRIAILELWTNHRPTLECHFARISASVRSIAAGECRRLEET